MQLPPAVRQYLHGPSLALLVAVPLTAGLVAGVLSAKYVASNTQATGTASVLILSGSQSSFDIVPFVNDFQSVVTSHQANQAAAAAAGAGGRLSAQGSSNGTTVLVRFSSRSARGARDGLVAAVRAGYMLLATRNQQRARILVTAATTAQQQAIASLNAVTQAENYQPVQDVYRQRSTDLQTASNQLAAATTPAEQARLQSRVASIRADVQRLSSLIADQQVKQSQLQDATIQLDKAVTDLTVADAVVKSVSAGNLVNIESVVRLPRASTILRTAVSGALGGLIAVIAIIALLQSRREATSDAEVEPVSAPSRLRWSEDEPVTAP